MPAPQKTARVKVYTRRGCRHCYNRGYTAIVNGRPVPCRCIHGEDKKTRHSAGLISKEPAVH